MRAVDNIYNNIKYRVEYNDKFWRMRPEKGYKVE